MHRSFLFLFLVLLLSPPASSASRAPRWSVEPDGSGELRTASFEVLDPDCAYSLIAEPEEMARYIPFVEEVHVNRRFGRFQDVTLKENFFPVGEVQSRYFRDVDGYHEVTWVLQEGRQKRHDGTWTVTRTREGGHVEFRNVIEAKSWLHKALLNNIQRRAMASIVDAAQDTCGVP